MPPSIGIHHSKISLDTGPIEYLGINGVPSHHPILSLIWVVNQGVNHCLKPPPASQQAKGQKTKVEFECAAS